MKLSETTKQNELLETQLREKDQYVFRMDEIVKNMEMEHEGFMSKNDSESKPLDRNMNS